MSNAVRQMPGKMSTRENKAQQLGMFARGGEVAALADITDSRTKILNSIPVHSIKPILQRMFQTIHKMLFFV
jgi:hypothetical protein